MNKTIQLNRTIIAALTAIAALLTAGQAQAATFQWINPATGSFLNPLNWTNTASPFANGVPGTADTGINNIPGSTTLITTGDTVTAGIVQPQTGTLSVTDGSFTATTVQATGSNGTFSVSGGTVNLANLQITGNGGVISMSGGNATVTTDTRMGAANGIWNVSGNAILSVPKLVLGSAAAGNTNNIMTISGNALVSQSQGIGGGVNRELWIGGNNAGSGTLILKDNATWSSQAANGSTDVIIGRAASAGQAPAGVLTIQDNASLTVGAGSAAAKVIRMADVSTSASGILNLNGGDLSVIGINRISGTATINANGGKITALAASANFFNNFGGTGGANSINLQAGGLTFDTSGFADTITNTLSGAGGLSIVDGGTLTLTRSNTYTGGTAIGGATLKLTGAGCINNSSSLAITNSATLDATVANPQIAIPGTLTFSDGTLIASLANTSVTAGSVATGGSVNTINITALPLVTNLPTRLTVIKYTTEGAGLVDGNNVLTTLGVTLPSVSSPQGFLTNNTVNKSIDLIITNMVLPPSISIEPAPDSAYSNFFAHFSVSLEATNLPGYQWRKDSVPLTNNAHISGANASLLKLSNVTSNDLGFYDVIITNFSGGTTSTPPASLTLLSPTGYEAAAVADVPTALYMFDDTNDPATTNAIAFDYAGDLDGIYGVNAQNGNPLYNIAGPRPSDGLPSFSATNLGVRFFGFTTNSHVTIPPLNLNTNTVTLCGWINPGNPAANAGLIFCRGGGTVAGLNFTGSVDGNGFLTLGYTWNNDPGTFGWNSQIAPTPGVWSFVALVVAPTNVSLYIFDSTGLRESGQNFIHVNQSFSVNSLIGEDGISTGNRQFDGAMDGVAIYGQALSQSQLETLYTAASGASNFPPVIWAQPTSTNLYEQQNAVFSVGVSGTQPLTYQWEYTDGGGVNFSNVTDGGRISGSSTATLTISNITVADATNFVLVVSNVANVVTSSVATLTINPISPAEMITNSIVEANGSDWNTAGAWSDGLPASLSAVSKPGSTYFIAPGGGLRTPNTTGNATFPGQSLTVLGGGVFESSVVTEGALILKGQSPGLTIFQNLVMDGGEILSFTDNNNPTIIAGGQINIVSNTPISGVSSTSGRSITIQSQLTGGGNIEVRIFNTTNFQPTFVSALDIAGTNDTYTGTWNVVGGTLVGSAGGALGTNTITVGVAGALQTTYDINSPNADLVLNGLLNLTQHDTFNRVFVAATQLNAGTYTFAQLTNSFAANFPASWLGQTGVEAFTTASGSLTVLTGPSVPGIIQIGYAGGNLQVTWTNAASTLVTATNLLGPWVTNSGAQSPFIVIPTGAQQFFKLVGH